MDTLSGGLSRLELEYDGLEITNVFDRPTSHLRPLIYTCGRTLVFLTLTLEECKLQYYMPYSDVMSAR